MISTKRNLSTVDKISYETISLTQILLTKCSEKLVTLLSLGMSHKHMDLSSEKLAMWVLSSVKKHRWTALKQRLNIGNYNYGQTTWHSGFSTEQQLNSCSWVHSQTCFQILVPMPQISYSCDVTHMPTCLLITVPSHILIWS
jgi:hypothetical protein